MSLVISLFCFSFLVTYGNCFEKKYDEEEGKAYLKKINSDIQVKTTESVLASWAYESNITDYNLQHQLDVSAKLANYSKEIWKETIKYPWKTFKDPDVRRQFQKLSVLGTAILSPPKYEKYNKIISDMQSVYGKAKICSYHNRSDCSLQLEPELTEIFVKSRDPDELRYYWKEWRNAAGKPVREIYKEYVQLSNEAAVLNNFTNNAEFWLKDYEAADFKDQVEVLWQQLRPLYLQLHAFVRRRLREQYGEQHVTKRGPIPAHLLGNMWAQSWSNIFDFTVPYPGKPSLDVTPIMVEKGYTPLGMFKLAEEFFTSLNLSPMPETFWKNSILEKPKDGRDLICHASAWDFYDGKDFRIKQCTRITMEDLNTVHHEMGHIQYFLQYKNQPLVYKEGTNPGFHEAVGDVMALSVSTPKHLRKIGLLNNTEDDAESEINQLYNMALDKIAFLPFGYLMDQWRWSVFEGKTTEKEYNCRWWQLREKYQGLSPSTVRTEEDFDPGAKYHTVGNVPYIRYFVSFVIQFQFHRSLCIAAKEFDPSNPSSKPLHKCDIYQSKEAGALLEKMLQMGSSKPWPDAMEVMTGQRKMDASALLEYFAVLQDWLEKENARTGEFIGWESSQKECVVDEETVKSSDSQGNFEDDNIAYSYAEFVRQDDNAFGFPDFLEETQPSYQALHHRSKENTGNCEQLMKRNGRRFSNNPYQPEGSHLQHKGKEFVRSALSKFPRGISQFEPLPLLGNLENLGNLGLPGHEGILGNMDKLGNIQDSLGSLGNMGTLGNLGNFGSMDYLGNLGNIGSVPEVDSVKNIPSIEQIKNLENVGNLENLKSLGNLKNMENLGAMKTLGNFQNVGNAGSLSNKISQENPLNLDQLPPLEKLRYERDKNLKLVSAILRNIEYMHNTKHNSDIPKPVYSTIMRRDIQHENVILPNNKDNKKELNSRDEKAEVKEGREEESKSGTEDKQKQSSYTKNDKESKNLKENVRAKQESLITGTKEGGGENAFDNSKLISKDPKMLRSSNDLLWKAELIKNEAEKMLKSLNYTPETSSNMNRYDQNISPNVVGIAGVLKSQKNTRNILPLYHTSEYFRPEKRSNSIELIKSTGVSSLRNSFQNRKPFRYKDDFVGVTSADNQLVRKEKLRQTRVTRGADSTFFVLLEKVPKRCVRRKKSYKEFHFKAKTPVVYNSVVLTPEQKTQDERQSLIMKTNPRGLNTKKYIRSSVSRKELN